MNIVIATAEPLGAYHLSPLYPAMNAATLVGHSFTHLIPYPEKVQGEPWRSSSADLSLLEAANLVVITGGDTQLGRSCSHVSASELECGS